MQPKRKIIQITEVVCSQDYSNHVYYRIITTALCNDNTLWRLDGFQEKEKWLQLPPIPQPEDEE